MRSAEFDMESFKKMLQVWAFLTLTPLWIVFGLFLVLVWIIGSIFETLKSLFEFSLSGKWNYTVQKIW